MIYMYQSRLQIAMQVHTEWRGTVLLWCLDMWVVYRGAHKDNN